MIKELETSTSMDDKGIINAVYTASISTTRSHSDALSKRLKPVQSQLTNSAKYEITDVTLLELLSNAILKTMEGNKHVPVPSWYDIIAPFYSIAPADMHPVVYVERLVKYLQCSRSAFVVALIYMQRIQTKHPKVVLTERNMHRLLITSIVISAKMLDDRIFSNSHYARVGGIGTVGELNRLEVLMMQMLDFDLFVFQEEYIVFILQMSMRQIPSLRLGFKQTIARMYSLGYNQAKSKDVMEGSEDGKETDGGQGSSKATATIVSGT